MTFEVGKLYWITYRVDNELSSFTGYLITETDDLIELERDYILQVPKDLIDRIWKVG